MTTPDLILHRAAARGRSRLDHAERRHSFSTGEFHDPARLGFGALRVLDEETRPPGSAGRPQRSANMQMLGLVLEGVLVHEDEGGRHIEVEAGGALCVAAGHGLVHSQSSAPGTAPLRWIRAWIQPDRVNAAPHADSRRFPPRPDGWCLLASGHGEAGTLELRQSARAWLAAATAGTTLQRPLQADCRYWLQVLDGALVLDGLALAAGDGVALRHASALALAADGAARALLFELPGGH